MEKKEVAIVFGITSNYVFALANVLIGMKNHCNKFWDDVIVFHDGISDNDKKNINKIVKCNFIDFPTQNFNPKINSKILSEYSLLSLARFECFNLLHKYKKVIWQDVDILIQKDISSLLQYGEKGGFSATITDANFLVESNFSKLILDYQMFKPLYNSGILVLSDKLDEYSKMSNWCYKKTLELAEVLRFPDQGILNLLIQEYNIQVEEIDILKFCCHPKRDGIYRAAIIHAYGSEKFWNNQKLLEKFPEWNKNNNFWLNISKEKNNVLVNNTQPMVSVIMSVYNRYKFLKESIDSILNQTYNNFEIIVVIEQGNYQDKIEKILLDYQDERIIIIKNNKRLGFSESLNIGINNSKGKYIARMDDDDISLLYRFEKQVEFLESHPEIGVCGGFIEFFMNSSGICTLPTTDEELKVHCLFATPLFHPTVMIRKEVLEKNDLQYNSNYFTEDYELWSRIINYTKLANLPIVLLKYRSSGENATITNNKKVEDSHLAIMERQFKEYLNLDLSYDELYLLNGRVNALQNIYNLKDTQKVIIKLYKKIYHANRLKRFYSKRALKNKFKIVYIKEPNQSIRNIIKKILSPIKPVYKVLMNRVYYYVEKRIQETTETFDDKLMKIKKEINDKCSKDK